VIKFNISMEEDKLKSIRRKAKNKGLFAFDATSSIRLVKWGPKMHWNKSKLTNSKEGLKKDAIRGSPEVKEVDLSPNEETRKQYKKKLSTNAKTFIKFQPFKKQNSRIKSNYNINSKNILKEYCPYNSNNQREKIMKKNKSSYFELKTQSRKNSPNGIYIYVFIFL